MPGKTLVPGYGTFFHKLAANSSRLPNALRGAPRGGGGTTAETANPTMRHGTTPLSRQPARL